MDLSSIEIRTVADYADLRACVELQYETWGEAFVDAVPASILKVAQRIGGVVLGAFDAEQTLVGFVFGLTGVERGQVVHWSDMLAVRPEARNLGLGKRLKEQQRQVVRELGASVIYWTYDPLVARNAHLNFNRLGVRLAEYAEDMYGTTESALHGAGPTDRLVVAWPTRESESEHLVNEAEHTLRSGDSHEAPIVTPEWISGASGAAILPHHLRVAIPANAETLMMNAPDEAAVWRQRVRCALQWAMAAGYTIRAFSLADGDDEGYYLLKKTLRSGTRHDTH